MTGKDCSTFKHTRRVQVFVTLLLAAITLPARSETIRIWPTAVVYGNNVMLTDVCRFSDAANVEHMREAVVAPSPQPGGASVLTSRDVQAALRKAGVNLATTIILGANQIEITRPRTAAVPMSFTGQPHKHTQRTNTLQAAVRRAFERRAKARGGNVQLEFGRTPKGSLSLSGPEFTFDVRFRGDRWLGRSIPVDVAITSKKGERRIMELIIHATMTRNVVVARRAINLHATIRPDDVELAQRSYENARSFGVDTPKDAVGQRAKRFIAAGDPVRLNDLEKVPLVNRGQLIDVYSVSGGIRVRSTGKAAGTGGMGDTIEVGLGERRQNRVNAVVTGDHAVTIGIEHENSRQLAMGNMNEH